MQTISAVSEEVSAHANETLAGKQENMQHLLTIAGRSQELIALTLDGAKAVTHGDGFWFDTE